MFYFPFWAAALKRFNRPRLIDSDINLSDFFRRRKAESSKDDGDEEEEEEERGITTPSPTKRFKTWDDKEWEEEEEEEAVEGEVKAKKRGRPRKRKKESKGGKKMIGEEREGMDEDDALLRSRSVSSQSGSDSGEK